MQAAATTALRRAEALRATFGAKDSINTFPNGSLYRCWLRVTDCDSCCSWIDRGLTGRIHPVNRKMVQCTRGPPRLLTAAERAPQARFRLQGLRVLHGVRDLPDAERSRICS